MFSRRWAELTATVSTADALLGAAVGIGVVAAGFGDVGPTGPGGDMDALATVMGATAGLVLMLRRAFPVSVLVVTNGLTLGWYLIGYPGRLMTLAPLIACYTLAAHRGWRWGAVGGVGTIAVTMVAVRFGLGGGWLDDQVVNAVMLEVAVIALGAAVHSHRAFAAGVAEHADRVAENRAEQARRAAAEKRLELARELHDVFGHTMAAISVQAGVAVHVMHRQPAQATEALTTIKRISDDGLAEVRVLLGVMRDPGDPLPRSGSFARQLEGLLDVSRSTGLDATLAVHGDIRPLPAPVELAVFRIVQESLTNVRRHARADTVRVRLDVGPDHLVVTVRDDGGTAASAAPDVRATAATAPAGHGIEGMRARAVGLGGRFSAGAVPGGFEVRTVLPLGLGGHDDVGDGHETPPRELHAGGHR
ncbi:MAG TPA: histidine kinase [Jiangellaceae bacterium]